MRSNSRVAVELVTAGRGILAADESIATMSARLKAEGVQPSRTTRRDYRELLVTAPGLADTVTGVILNEETFNDCLADGRPFPVACDEAGLIPGIKVDSGTREIPHSGGALVTTGLDGLDQRLSRFAANGARFAKWRAVIDVATMSDRSLDMNASALARYAALCQGNDLVPIIEPEVLCSGNHPLSRCSTVTLAALEVVFRNLEKQAVDLSAIVLKPNLVTPGLDVESAAPAEVAAATMMVLLDVVPADVPGIAFLSGGHPGAAACAYLGAINELGESAPWSLTFSFGRALVSDALHAWQGDPAKVESAQQVLLGNCRRASDAVRRRTSSDASSS